MTRLPLIPKVRRGAFGMLLLGAVAFGCNETTSSVEEHGNDHGDMAMSDSSDHFHLLAALSETRDGQPSAPLVQLAGNGDPTNSASVDLKLVLAYRNFDVAGLPVRLRTYELAEGANDEAIVGPYIQALPNSKVSITIENQLPMYQDHDGDEEDLQYFFYVPWQNNREAQAVVNDAAQQGTVTARLDALLKQAQGESLWGTEAFRTYGGGSFRSIWQHYQWPTGMQGKTLHTIRPQEYWTFDRAGDSTWHLIVEENVVTGTQVLKVYMGVELTHADHNAHSNTPHHFNYTNFHTHGWHVSPRQDNIFVNVDPQPPGQAPNTHRYYYDLKDHPAGTFWYHPHVHGSTAIQVASGASGPLIVKDEGLEPGSPLALATRRQDVMVFNQILFHPEIGELPDYTTLTNLFSALAYPPIKEALPGTTINGETNPLVSATAGRVKRLRFINSGFRSNLAYQFPDDVEVYQISVDGLYFPAARKVSTLSLAPGNRTDVIIRPKSAGTFAVRLFPYNANCEYWPNDPAYCQPGALADTLFTLRVAQGNGTVDEAPTTLPKQFPDIPESSVTGPTIPINFAFVGDYGAVNGEPYAGPQNYDQIIDVQAGTAQRWELQGQNHPFHIHVNPFQVYEFNGKAVDPPMWKDVIIGQKNGSQAGSAFWRTQYTPEYTGQFVLHCHILSHEDAGMMRDVIVRDPNTPLSDIILPDTCTQIDQCRKVPEAL